MLGEGEVLGARDEGDARAGVQEEHALVAGGPSKVIILRIDNQWRRAVLRGVVDEVRQERGLARSGGTGNEKMARQDAGGNRERALVSLLLAEGDRAAGEDLRGCDNEGVPSEVVLIRPESLLQARPETQLDTRWLAGISYAVKEIAEVGYQVETPVRQEVSRCRVRCGRQRWVSLRPEHDAVPMV